MIPFPTLYKTITAITLTLLLAGINGASALTFPDKPSPDTFIVDTANLVSPEHGKEIDAIALSLLVEHDIPIIVVTINSLIDQDAAGYSIEGYAADLFDEWGIGSESRNFGILLLVSPGDRKARIELGAGWERNHDRQAKQVMDTLIVPDFRDRMFSEGILEGVRGLDALARGLNLPQPKAPWWLLPAIIISGILLIMLIVNLFKTGKSGWAWAVILGLGAALLFFLWAASKSGGGGSSGSFGGGFSGGGGATGSW